MLEVIQRYKPVIEEIKKANKKIKILDVGGGSESIAPFVKEKLDITSCDVSFRKEKIVKTVKCYADNLPFKDKAFDFVISIDTLEHIPKEKRKKAIEEMLRVAREKVVIACPCGKKSAGYEKLLIKFAKLFGRKLPWLEEHKKEGLPEIGDVEKILGSKKFIEKKNMNLTFWLFANFLDFITRPIQKIIGPRNMMRIYGPVSKLLNFGRCYRQIFIVKIK